MTGTGKLTWVNQMRLVLSQWVNWQDSKGQKLPSWMLKPQYLNKKKLKLCLICLISKVYAWWTASYWWGKTLTLPWQWWLDLRRWTLAKLGTEWRSEFSSVFIETVVHVGEEKSLVQLPSGQVKLASVVLWIWVMASNRLWGASENLSFWPTGQVDCKIFFLSCHE